MTSTQRQIIETEIERLISLLDAIDGDVDLEPTGDELDTADSGLSDDRVYPFGSVPVKMKPTRRIKSVRPV